MSNYTKNQKAFIRRHDLKVGDLVKVTKAAGSFKLGWENEWLGVMSNQIGAILSVTNLDQGSDGIELDDGLDYPYFVLEKVKVEPAKTVAKPTYADLQKMALAISGWKEGDRVIIRRQSNEGDFGFKAAMEEEGLDWMPDASFVGRKFKIRSVEKNYIEIEDKDENSFAEAFFNLEKIESLPEFELEDYTVEVQEDGSLVCGCQDISFDLLEKIYQAAKEVKNKK